MRFLRATGLAILRWRRRRAVERLGRAWALAAVFKERASVLDAKLERLDELIRQEVANNGKAEG